MPERPPESATEVEAAAVRWAAKVDRGPLSIEDEAALEAWAAADSRRRGAYARALAASTYLDRASALGPNFKPARAAARLPSRRTALGVGAGLIAASAAAISFGWFNEDLVRTSKGDVRRISLPEGSAVTLNTQSAIRSDFGASLRRIEIVEGEALFDVARDPARPFVVVAGELQARAIGTSFTVRRFADGRAWVAVREGIVEVTYAGAALRLTAGMLAEVGADGRMAQSARPLEQVERAMAWREGRIDLAGRTLGEAASEFARYSDRKIYVDDPLVARMRVAGVYSLSDPEGFARAAALSLGLSAHPEADGVRLQHR